MAEIRRGMRAGRMANDEAAGAALYYLVGAVAPEQSHQSSRTGGESHFRIVCEVLLEGLAYLWRIKYSRGDTRNDVTRTIN